MRKKIHKILVTGGAGFIGSAFVRQVVSRGCGSGISVIIVDNLTYAGDIKRLAAAKGKYKFYKTDISDKPGIQSIFKREKPDTVVHFAAETHVDRSILDPTSFLKTNIIGTQVLIDAARRHSVKKFVHISTDEVYGDIKKGRFTEDSPIRPNSPYAASKAAADLLIRSYIRTYKFPAVIIRPSNNYGPWQYPEKFIPLAILKLSRGEKIPVYANGKNVREWLYVEDCAKGVLKIIKKGRTGQIYNLGSREKMENIAVAKLLLKIMGKKSDMIEFVKDRPGHDFRYSLSSHKVFNETGWSNSLGFKKGLVKTADWSLLHRAWFLGKQRDALRLDLRKKKNF